MTASRRLRVAFLHLHLGMGGAARLTLAAAQHLHQCGHEVVVFTTRFDATQALDEARGLVVRVRASWLPAHLAERARAACSVARMAALTSAAAAEGPFDLAFCDLVPHVVPFLKWRLAVPVIFYCHFPDLALAPSGGWLRRLYRAPLDWLERRGMRRADRVLVNSRFTEAAVRRLCGEALPLQRLYPAVPLVDSPGPSPARSDGTAMILSINRFAPSKNLPLAIEALQQLRHRLTPSAFAGVRMVVAGGFDAGRADDRQAVAAVRERIAQYGLGDVVTVQTSCSDEARQTLLSQCRCVIYTALDEPFGLVPLEAMAAGRPVVGIAQGGLLETVVPGETGILCPPEPAAVADALARLITDGDDAARMGAAGRAHVAAHFSARRFGVELDAVVQRLVGR